MDADSSIQALQQFIAQRGKISALRSENGSNFVGAQKKIGNTFKEMDDQKIQYFLQNTGADYTVWHRYPPTSSHMGDVWEIRSVQNIVLFLLKTHKRSLNDESLRTLLAETEAILNSRLLLSTLWGMSKVNNRYVRAIS